MNFDLLLVAWVASVLGAFGAGWALRRPSEAPGALRMPPGPEDLEVPVVGSPVTDSPTAERLSRLPWVDGALGLQFLRRCTDRMVQSVTTNLRATTDPMTANLLDIQSSLANLSAEIRRHDRIIQSGDDLERVESLAQGALAAMEEVAQVTLGSAQSFEGHLRALQLTQEQILETSAQIGDLAERINVLSINASIEAARAGSAGKGFKVIAIAVKALARESAELLQAIEVSVEKTAGLFTQIRADLEVQRTRVSEDLAHQGARFGDFRSEFSAQRRAFESLIQAISQFLGGLEVQISGLSPVTQTHEIAVQELEDLALVVSDGLTSLAVEAAENQDLPQMTSATAAFWAALVRRRLTTASELHHLDGVLSDLGWGSEIPVTPAPTVELF